MVCFSALLVHHGLRDALITALPTLASNSTSPSPTVNPALLRSTQENEIVTVTYEESVYTANTNLTFTAPYGRNITFKNRKQLEETLTATHTLSAADTKQISSDATTIYSSPTVPLNLAVSQVPLEEAAGSVGSDQARINISPLGISSPQQKAEKTKIGLTKSEEPLEEAGLNVGSEQARIKNSPLGISSIKQKVEKTNKRADNVSNGKSESESTGDVRVSPPLSTSRGGKDTSSPVENVKDRTLTHLSSKRINSQRTKYTVPVDHSAIDELKREASGPVTFRGRRILAASSPSAQRHNTDNQGQEEKEEDVDGRKIDIESFSQEGYKLKDEWSLILEGVVLSSAYWGWFFAALLADPLMDRVGVSVVLSASVGVAGLLGLLMHAASLGGPWALLGLRVVQGTVQGVSYPSVVRVLEGIPSGARATAGLLVFMGPSLGTGLGAGLGALPQWYVATYVLGSVAIVLTPLCLMLPPPSDAAPHKEMLWKSVLSSKAVWACVGVHMSYTWMLYTLLVGLPFCLTYDLGEPSASGWVVAAAAVSVSVAVRLLLFLASKLNVKKPSTVLTRRRIPVVAGTVMVTVAVIVMATAKLDATALVGVGVGLAGLGVGVARVGYRLSVDDMAPLGAWRVTKVLDAAAVITAALSPLLVSAMAQDGEWRGEAVWLSPLAALPITACLHLFLLTTNPQPWDQTDKSTSPGENGAAAGGITANGLGPPLSIGRQSFKSARSALTFKTARSGSRSRTRTVSCRTIDDDLDGDMHSVANSNVECRSVVDEADQECVSVASSSTFKSDGADMHSVVDETEVTTAPGKQPGQKFGSMLVNGGTTDRTSAWLSSHHDIVLEAGGTQAAPTRTDTHANNAIYGLFW